MERAAAAGDKSYLCCCDYAFYRVRYLPIVGVLFYLAEANRLFIDLHKYRENVASAGCDKISYYCEAIMHLLSR